MVPCRLGILKALGCVPVLATVGCAGAGAGPAQRIPDDQPGLYEFDARVPATVNTPDLKGTIEVRPDTVIVTLDGAYCRPDQDNLNRSRLEAFAYRCGEDVTFSFDRARPLWRPRASVGIRIPYTRTVCEQWETTTAGRVCVRSTTETLYRTERRVVRLSVKPRPGTGSPG